MLASMAWAWPISPSVVAAPHVFFGFKTVLLLFKILRWPMAMPKVVMVVAEVWVRVELSLCTKAKRVALEAFL